MVQPNRPAITVAVVATRIISSIQIILGVVAFSIGVATISILTSTAHFADQYGLGLFGGVFICLLGFVGMFSSFRFNNRSLCLLNFLCNVFIWFLVLVWLVLFGLAADFYERMKDATYCFRIRDMPITAYYNRNDYNLRLYDPICLAEQNKMAPDGYIFSLVLSIIYGVELFVGVAAMVFCCKALYGMCGGTTPRVQNIGQKYGYPVQQQQQNPVNYSKGYEMKSSGMSSSTNDPPPAYKPQPKAYTQPASSAPQPKKNDSSTAPSYFL